MKTLDAAPVAAPALLALGALVHGCLAAQHRAGATVPANDDGAPRVVAEVALDADDEFDADPDFAAVCDARREAWIAAHAAEHGEAFA